MEKKITACLICAALACGMCGCNGGEDNPSAGIETAATVTETSETASETSATTEAKTETKASETAETTESTKGLTVSPSGYVLDPNIIFKEENRWDIPEKQPCLIGEPLEGVRFYGLNGGEELSYTYDQPAWGEDEYDQYIIIEHDGIADEFAGLWIERSGTAMSLYPADLDGDGETEIAAVRYGVGGMFCHVMELVIYKLNEGHYERLMFNTQDFNDKYISVDVDSENRVLTVSANGFDKSFAYDFSESVPPEMTEIEVDLVQINDFVLDGGEITYIVTPLLSGYGPVTFVDICFKLKFADSEFTCTDAEFKENEPYRPAEQEYAVDFDTAVSNIIAAGIEADNSEFVLSGTEDSDGETYYRIIKGYDNGEAVSAEEIFRVNVQNGSVYVYFDPTLPTSDYLAQFKSEADENDPQSRYIQIYSGTS